jgi:hypothetical protein
MMYSRIRAKESTNGMSDVITTTVQLSGGRIAQAGHYARTAWTLVNAVIAVVAGISTLNLAIANTGMATLNEAASPFMQQFARMGRQA